MRATCLWPCALRGRCPGELEVAALVALLQHNRTALAPAPSLLMQLAGNNAGATEVRHVTFCRTIKKNMPQCACTREAARAPFLCAQPQGSPVARAKDAFERATAQLAAANEGSRQQHEASWDAGEQPKGPRLKGPSSVKAPRLLQPEWQS